MATKRKPRRLDRDNKSRNSHIFLYILAFRLVNALSLKTFFQPDEYWQSLEPAHQLAFGYGYRTWEWKHGLRSYLHPLIFASIYKLAQLFGLYESQASIILPKILQGTFAALGDYYSYRFAQAYYLSREGKSREVSSRVPVISLWCSLTSAFEWFVLPRTFSNSLELVLTAYALCYWPWKSSLPNSLRKATVAIWIAIVLRPTNAILWVIPGLNLIYTSRSLRPILSALVTGVPILSLTTALDFYFYGHAAIPAIKFLQFNFVESLSQFYGVNAWHYYLSQGLPISLTVLLIPLIYDIYKCHADTVFDVAGSTAVFVIFIFSLVSHKEVRFIMPILPILHLKAAHGIYLIPRPKLRRAFWILVLAINVPLIYYVSFVHQRGVIDVIDYLRDTLPPNASVGFLMPCHSTPWQSQLHRPDVDAWFLTCEPPIGFPADEMQTYMDEADVFYADPAMFLANLPTHNENPSYLVLFESLLKTIDPSLDLPGYVEVARFFNSHMHDDWRRRGDVIVLRRDPD